jgi:lupus La protein
MSNLKVETTEPDQAATSLPNDKTANKEGGDPSAPTDKEAIMADSESKDTNGKAEVEEKTEVKNKDATDVREEKNDEKANGNGTPQSKKQRTYDNGVLKTSGQEGRGRNSKYDPSILPTTDDPSKIRAQV